MELDKRKYKRQQVIAMVEAYRNEYETKLREYKSLISQLSNKNAELNAEIDRLKGKEGLVLSTLERAEKTAVEIKEQAELQYAIEIERLNRFVSDLEKYFDEIKEKYPSSTKIKKAINVKDQLKKGLKEKKGKALLDELDGITKDQKRFDPKSKIKDYIVATESGGFNMDDVLNPGDIKLEDLCKELGLMEENE